MKRCDTEPSGVRKTDLRRDFRDAAYRSDVDRANNRLADCDVSAVIGVIPVADRSAVCISERLIFIAGSERFVTGIQCRGVRGKDFKGRAGLTQRISGAI